VDAVVVVDDQAPRRVVTDALTRRGHAVSAFSVAESAWPELRHKQIPLLVLDGLLPGGSGLELCRRLRALPTYWDCLILVITAQTQPEGLTAALDAGADDCLAPSLDAAILETRLIVAEHHVATRAARRSDDERRHASDQRFRGLVERLPIVTYVAALEPAGTLQYVSPQVQRLVGVTATDWLTHPRRWIRHLHADDRQRVLDLLARTVATGDPLHAEYRLLTDDGQTRWVRDEAVVIRREPPRRGYLQGVLLDITAHKQAEEALRRSEAQYRRIVDTAEEGIWIVDARGVTTFVNRRMAELLGYTVEELQGAPMSAFRVQDEETRAARRERSAAGTTRFFDTDVQYRRKDGSTMWAIVSSRPTRDASEQVPGMLTMVTDITERKQSEQALEHQALHDTLTGLPNRTLLDDRLQLAIRTAHRAQTQLALLLMDLNRFKEVNDTLGHDVGDQLLRQVGQRVQAVLRASDTVGRLGGDEFVVLLPTMANRDHAMAAARKILAAVATPISIGAHAVSAGASIGIAFYPAHGEDAMTLLRHADVAMYAAKRGKFGGVFF